MTTTVIVSSVEILFTRFVFPQLQFSSGVHKLEWYSISKRVVKVYVHYLEEITIL